MNIKEILQGIEILRPYYTDSDGYHVGADHDIIYLYATDNPLPAEVAQQLFDLGWNQCDSEESEDGEHTVYDPENSWSCYV